MGFHDFGTLIFVWVDQGSGMAFAKLTRDGAGTTPTRLISVALALAYVVAHFEAVFVFESSGSNIITLDIDVHHHLSQVVVQNRTAPPRPLTARSRVWWRWTTVSTTNLVVVVVSRS